MERENAKKSAKKVKKDKVKKDKEKKGSSYRTEEERQYEARVIINKLTELKLTIQYEPIRELLIIIQNYIRDGKKQEINIAFPMINKRIKGILADSINEKCVIKLEHEIY